MESVAAKLPPELRLTQRKNSEILYHWYAFLDNFHSSPVEFYAAVEQALTDRKVPGLDVSRQDWCEGGLLSDKRHYLRLTRERLVFDICASPFGTGYFFSCRFCHNRPPISILAVLGLSFLVYKVFQFLYRMFGFVDGLFALVVVLCVTVWVLRNAVALGLSTLDATLMKAPVIGPVYERLFRRETYYRVDTRIMYLEAVPRAVKEVVERVTAANGVKLFTIEEKPLLRNLTPQVDK